jgi:hypothetical protein
LKILMDYLIKILFNMIMRLQSFFRNIG